MIEPYLNLRGRAEEAMNYYGIVFGVKDKFITTLSQLPENPEIPLSEETKNLVAYGKMEINGSAIHFSDMQTDELSDKSMISLMVKFDSEEELKKAYYIFADEGQALMELSAQPYARQFAWVKDKFGIDWQLIYE